MPPASVKRPLWISRKYRIVDLQGGSAAHELIGVSVRVERQLPDSHWPHPWLVVECVILSGRRFNERIMLDGVRLQRETDPSEICLCPAYLSSEGRPFPHRLGGGKCGGPPYCGICGLHCTARSFRPTREDREFAVILPKVAWESSCCEGNVYSDSKLTNLWDDEY